MKEFLPISLDELKQYAKNPTPDNWIGAGMQAQEINANHITYGFVVETKDEGERSVGMVSFDKTTVARWYEKDGTIQKVSGEHWEKSIVMYDDEEAPTYGSYGLTMAGLLKVCDEMARYSKDRLIIRTDETNKAALGLFKKIGLDVYPEYDECVDKKGHRELMPTSGRVVDATIEQMRAGIKHYRRSEHVDGAENTPSVTQVSPTVMKRMMTGGR
ncbi:MAG: hypothetical protein IKY98_01505 [Alphaproteobacteria bacterium]|nr:hypothetical protein [Alphaproteobacteria bacterium]